MRKLLTSLAVGGLVLAPTAQAQDDVSVYRAAGPWAVDYGDDYCRIGRAFTNGSDELEFALERLRPGAEVKIWLIGDGLKFFRSAEQLGYTFLPAQGERTVRALRATPGGKQVVTFPYQTLAMPTPPAPGTPPGPPKYDPAAEQAAGKAISAIQLSKGLTKPVRVETGALDAPIAALQTCADDLVKSWGVDPAKQSALSAQPVPQGSPWLPAGTIPFGEFAKLSGGANLVRVMVDPAGKASSCHIQSPTLDQALNDKVCKAVLEKASFTPAKDAGGQAIASYWIGSPTFMMPGPGGRR